MPGSIRAAADGGTFADILPSPPDGGLAGPGALPSPQNDDGAVVEGVRDPVGWSDVAPEADEGVVHGKTVATNAVLERRDAPEEKVSTGTARHEDGVVVSADGVADEPSIAAHTREER